MVNLNTNRPIDVVELLWSLVPWRLVTGSTRFSPSRLYLRYNKTVITGYRVALFRVLSCKLYLTPYAHYLQQTKNKYDDVLLFLLCKQEIQLDITFSAYITHLLWLHQPN